MALKAQHQSDITELERSVTGKSLPEQPKSGKLRIKQYQKYHDSKARFEIALKIVQTKVESIP